MSENQSAIDFVRYVLEQICSEKEAISVEEINDDHGTMIQVEVADSDMGKLIGKGGQNISALRTLVRIMGVREEKRIAVKILDSNS